MTKTITLSDDRLRAYCAEAAAEVLETMFFEIPLEEPAIAREAAGDGAFAAEARFDGDVKGFLRLRVDRAPAGRLAAGFLGIEPGGQSETDCGMVVAEMANMLCGATISRLFPESALRIEAPRLSAGEGGGNEPGCPWLGVALEDGALWAQIACEVPA